MARDERFKKVQGAGADFLEIARTRAEEFLRELSRAGGDTQDRAQGALDDLMEGGRKGTEQLVSLVRREVANQLGLLGLATKEDLAALERRMTGRVAATKAAAKAPAAKTAASRTATKTAATKTPAARTATRSAATKTGAGKATAKKAAAKKTAG
jgi:polyhydroxyalkanoate synthesis regulator phasin